MSSVSTVVRRTVRNFRIRRDKDNKSVIRLQRNWKRGARVKDLSLFPS